MTPQEPRLLRALLTFDRLPARHKTFRCDDDGYEPHIHLGEHVVVDTTDRAPQHGEVYLLKYRSGRHAIQQINIARGIEISRKRVPKDDRVWWLDSIRRFRNTGKKAPGDIPVFAGLSDGPYETHDLRPMIVGRVVGVAASALGRPIKDAAEA